MTDQKKIADEITDLIKEFEAERSTKPEERFSVSLTYIGSYFSERFETFQKAVDFAVTKGFEATIHDIKKGGVAGTWSPISGSNRW